jgi:hypothetical protein
MGGNRRSDVELLAKHINSSNHQTPVLTTMSILIEIRQRPGSTMC